MHRLEGLSACNPTIAPQLPQELQAITTPLDLSKWQSELQGHPDQTYAEFITRGIQYGFRIGFNYSLQNLKPCRKNLRSATEHPSVVDAYLCNELSKNRLTRIQDPSILPWFQPNAFGVIPKRHKPGKWRLIVDLSAPEGYSINDFIDKELCSISYISIDHVAEAILHLGQGALLAKADVKEAFRIVPVAPEDRLLLAMWWQGELYFDKVLPFGLRSAPIIFTAIADGIEWIIRQRGVHNIFHYVDDFIIVGRPDTQECASALATTLETFSALGVPAEPEKCEGPSTTLPILGIEVDTVEMQLRLPADKLHCLNQSIREWRGRKSCRKRELLSLLGSLQHAAKVVKPGRAFVRWMIELSTVRKHMDAYIRINQQFRADLEWWYQMVSTWNGVSILAPLKAEVPDHIITSDASGNWGCGAFHANEWFQMQWDSHTAPLHITIKELLPVVIATAIWGRNWIGKTVRALCDNMAVVHIIRTRQSKDHNAMHLMRCLALIECSFHFTLVSRHIPGKHNDLADALSRNNLPHFLTHYPQAQPTPTPIPTLLYKALISQQPNWTSTTWADQFGTIISRV